MGITSIERERDELAAYVEEVHASEALPTR
jgi:hypothetical protein